MAAVEVTISGMLYDKINRTTQNVVLIGEATLTGIGIGGGPIVPPGSPPWEGVGKPPIVAHPIWPPNIPGQGPILPPPIDPPPDITPPPPGMAIKPPPPGGGWAYVQPWGWGYFPPPGQAGPKA